MPSPSATRRNSAVQHGCGLTRHPSTSSPPRHQVQVHRSRSRLGRRCRTCPPLAKTRRAGGRSRCCECDVPRPRKGRQGRRDADRVPRPESRPGTELRARQPDEYLLHPKWSLKRPLDRPRYTCTSRPGWSGQGYPRPSRCTSFGAPQPTISGAKPGTCCSRNNSSGTNPSRPRRDTCIRHATTSPRRSPASKS